MTTNWAIHRVSLATHALDEAETFFGRHLGLGSGRRVDARTLAFGEGSRGLRVQLAKRGITRLGDDLVGPVGARHVALEIEDLQRVATRLDRASIASVPALAGDFDVPALYTTDPAGNVVAFCQRTRGAVDAGVHPREPAWGWGIHHVNLEAPDVRETVAFYVEIADLPEGRWRAPAARGDFSIDPKELSVLALDDANRGLHIIRSDPGFAIRNGFAHNPSVGGHPAFHVPDVLAVKSRLETAGILVSDAKVYAMAGMHQIYVYDPTTNMIEVNQFV